MKVKILDAKAHYDRLIEENNDSFRDPLPLQEYMDKWDGAIFLDSMGLTEQKNVLEIGVGTGRIADKAAQKCKKLIGIDISQKTIERAKENLAGHQNVELVCADFMNYNFDKRFDVIYSSLTLMHFEDKQAFVSKAALWLADDGTFVLSIDKDQSGYIDMGDYKVKVYPDDPASIKTCISAANMYIRDRFETEFAHIFVCSKKGE